MPKKRYNAEEIIHKLRETDVLLSQEINVSQVCKRLDIAEQTYYRWRKANVTGLEWSQLDLERRVAWVHSDQAKARKAIGIPLNAEAILVLRRQAGRHPCFVFTHRGKPVRNVNTKAWKAALRRAGITDFRWHDLRHTWASRWRARKYSDPRPPGSKSAPRSRSSTYQTFDEQADPAPVPDESRDGLVRAKQDARAEDAFDQTVSW